MILHDSAALLSHNPSFLNPAQTSPLGYPRGSTFWCTERNTWERGESFAFGEECVDRLLLNPKKLHNLKGPRSPYLLLVKTIPLSRSESSHSRAAPELSSARGGSFATVGAPRVSPKPRGP